MAEYIDKQTVLDIITEYEKAQIKQKGIPITGVASIAIEIEDLPAADVRENVKGKWIESDPLDYYIFYKCSICRHSGNEAFDFCPNCGADMRGNYD